MAMTLVGRRAECAALDRLIADGLAGTSRVAVLRGEAGVGKSALLRYFVAEAAGWHVATAVGLQYETQLPYSGLHQLCAPMLGHLERLPGPQRDALATVFGRSAGPAPDRFLVGLATLALFAKVAEEQPLVCIIDDVQWLDHETSQIIEFVARRLHTERVAILCAARSGIGDERFGGLPELSISGLADADARALLLENVFGPLDPAVCEQIVMDSHGNPLALLELPRTWNPSDLAGGFGLPRRSAVPGKIEKSYARRLQRMSSETRLLVLVAASDPLGDPLLLHRAAETLNLDIEALGPAVDARLLAVGGRAEFAHPLVRSASYNAATTDDRHRVHRALAEATNPETDPDRRAWHRARATPGLDDEVAAELEQSARLAGARGGIAAAGAFLKRSVALTADPVRRAERALIAARTSVQAGDFDAAGELLARAEAGPLDDFQRARHDAVRARLLSASNRGNEATPLLLAAARRLEPLDIGLARTAYVDAFSSALFGARPGRVGVREVADAARAALPPPDEDGAVADLLLNALVAVAGDYDTAVAPCRDALRRLADDERPGEERPRWMWQGCVIALEMWDADRASALSHRGVRRARERGALTELFLALSAHTSVLVFCGDLAAAASAVAETRMVKQVTGIVSAPYGALILAAWRGDERRARELIERTVHDAGSRGEGGGLTVSEYARAVLCNARGQYEEALTAASSASDHREVVVENWGLSELVEPATRTGRTDRARDALERLTVKARSSGSAWALGIEARSRALLSEGDTAEALFREAIAHLSTTRLRGELARTHLLYGEYLRRINRRVDARCQLRSAHGMFDAMGMEAFAERARHELLATGQKVRKRNDEMRDQLTPQEDRIAHLAGDGMSNPEIGAQLFISARTVEWHLHKVFAKLGIRSRRQLRAALPQHVRLLPSA
jgi:DNA-binding CsgD family transcriptional regulator